MDFLEITNLNISYPTRRLLVAAVQDVSFSVRKGEILGLVGESGSGKSTIGRAILGLLDEPGKIEGGTIQLENHDLADPATEISSFRGKRIGLIFQDPQTSLNPVMTIGEQLIETIQTHLQLDANEARKRAVALLDDVGIINADARFNDYPHQFSGGMRQRVVIALALCADPDILIADEPTTALDVSIQSQILALLQKLKADRNLAVILITHDMAVISEVADRVVVLKDGRIVEMGAPAAVLGTPSQTYTKSLVSSVPPTDRRIDRFPIMGAEQNHAADHNLKILNRWQLQKNTGASLVRVEALSKSFSSEGFMRIGTNEPVHAVRNVSFEIREGESFGLVGESGSGKSTIAKMIVRLIEPTSGAIFFEQDDITTLDGPALLAFRRKIQMVFQDPYSSLNGRMKIKNIIAEPILHHNARLERADIDHYVDDLLAAVDLPASSKERYPHEFSGGQRQRISIARALATQPKLLVCDEPTSALDVSIQAQILNLLKDLQEKLGLTILFISHDLPVVRQMCDRIAVLKDGAVCEIAAAEQLFASPEHSYSQHLLNSMPKFQP
ncbi:MAG: ABC transporter ATP-binding protein [SAR116 cluster bacterium]|jgi:peptide/nickel transport system ATP-binding protein|nr:MAG: ABC transporter ATP-binding protein [SAR116 cluster bacterium]